MIKYELDENDLQNMIDSEVISGSDYEIERKGEKGSIKVEMFPIIVQDLLIEIDKLNEVIKDIVKDRDDNYKQIDPMEQAGMCEQDFI